jgi:opacity protein-like surface antigen
MPEKKYNLLYKSNIVRLYAAFSFVAVCALLSGSAKADETDLFSDYYLKIGLGSSWSQKVKGDLTALATGTGGGFGSNLGQSALVGIGAGALLPMNFRTDLTVVARPRFRVSSSEADPVSGLTFQARSKSSSDWTVLTNLYYDLPTGFAVRPYVGAGLGMAYNSLGTVTYSADGTVSGSEPGASRDSFAWAAMAGLGVALSDGWVVDVGYRYLDAGDIRTTGVVTDAGGARNTFAPVTANLRSNEVELSIRYRF